MNKKIVLIDGHSILNRAFYGVPDLTTAEGIHTNAVYGFLNIMFKILDEEKADYLTVAFDFHAPTFRHEIFKEYKGTRKAMPEELRQQVPIIKEVLQSMNITILEKEGYEADDILGTVAKMAEKEGFAVSLLSGDRDLLQLATDKIKIRIPKTKKGNTEIEDYYEKDVLETYQVSSKQIIELKALMGDASDNIPGIPGVGEKTAAKIIGEYGTIENAYEHVEEIKPPKARESLREHYDLAQLSKVLATIKIDCELDFETEKAVIGELYTTQAYQLFKKLEFKNLLGRFESDLLSNKIEDHFKESLTLPETEEVFARLAKSHGAGIQILEDGDFFSLAMAFGEKEVYFIPAQGFVTKEYLIGKLQDSVVEVKKMSTFELKSELPYLNSLNKDSLLDVGIAAYLINPLKNNYSYDDIAKEHMGIMVPSKEDLLGKLRYGKAYEEKHRELLTFACYMAYVAYEGMNILETKLEETNMKPLFHEIEMPLLFALYHMERAGIKVAGEELQEYGKQLAVRIKELELEIYRESEREFNINSPKQLGEILFEDLKLPFAKKTKTGYSTAADVLEKLIPEHKIVPMILEYRQLTKLKSTYADGLAAYIGEDQRIHGTFNQTIAATGRISSTEPNLQNIPIKMELGRLIRKVFIPEDGYIFIDADYSQIELRVLAHLSNDQMLIQAYQEHQDIHRITASQVFHTPFEEVTSLQRSNAKAVNFGIVYGISSFGLSQDLSISRKEAGDYIEKYFETYPGVKRFLDEAVEKAKETGYVTTMFGRRRPIPELSSSNFMQRSFGERVAMNSPIQGTAADIIKIAMIQVDKRLKEENLKSRIILQVHDELLIEALISEEEKVKAILSEEMVHAASLSVPLEIDIHTGNNWYEAK